MSITPTGLISYAKELQSSGRVLRLNFENGKYKISDYLSPQLKIIDEIAKQNLNKKIQAEVLTYFQMNKKRFSRDLINIVVSYGIEKVDTELLTQFSLKTA